MLAIITWAVGIAGKILLVVFLINLFRMMKKGGKDTVEQIADTAGLAVKLGVTKAQKWLWAKYKETDKEPKKSNANKESNEKEKAFPDFCKNCQYLEICRKAETFIDPNACPVAKAKKGA